MVIGNRPQFVKAAAVSGRLRAVADEMLVHTGQHHDDDLSRVFFDEPGLATGPLARRRGKDEHVADRAHAGG